MIFEFLRYCLGNKVADADFVAGMDWRRLYAFASKQAMLGFCFYGVERLGKECPGELRRNPIGQDLLMCWMGQAQMVRRRNMLVNTVAAHLYDKLRGDGLRCCILKGQGNALMYPNPYSRTPGDIDVWVNDGRKAVMEYAKGHFPQGGELRYNHLETTMEGVPVELHFIPCLMNNPLYNGRLQRWFGRNADLQCSNVVTLPDGAGEMAVPTTSFNVIYQLCHLYHHFFDEGIGMRQMIDYYYVMEDYAHLQVDGGGCGKGAMTPPVALQRELRYLGLWHFAGAVMYVMRAALGLPEDRMICPMDRRRGALLLVEIMDGGNFGRHYTKYDHFTRQGMAKKYFLKIWRNMHFVRYYPGEALCEPVFRTWHFLWRWGHRGASAR